MEILDPRIIEMHAPRAVEAVLSGGVASAVMHNALIGDINPNYASTRREAAAVAILGATILTNVVEQDGMMIVPDEMPSDLHRDHANLILTKMSESRLVAWDRDTASVRPGHYGRQLVREGLSNALDITPRVRGVYRNVHTERAINMLMLVGTFGAGLKYGVETLAQSSDPVSAIESFIVGTAIGGTLVGATTFAYELGSGLRTAKLARLEYLRLSQQQAG